MKLKVSWIDRLLLKLYSKLHKKFHAQTLRWYVLTASTEGRVVRVRVYGPEGMRMTDVSFEEMPGRVEWYRIRKEEREGEAI